MRESSAVAKQATLPLLLFSDDLHRSLPAPFWETATQPPAAAASRGTPGTGAASVAMEGNTR